MNKHCGMLLCNLDDGKEVLIPLDNLSYIKSYGDSGCEAFLRDGKELSLSDKFNDIIDAYVATSKS